MILAGVFGGLLCVLLIIGDWYYFTTLHPLSAQYGFGIARRRDCLDHLTRQAILQHFGTREIIQLPHGIARWCKTQEVVSLRPSYQLFSMRFRTAWPLKGTIKLHPADASVELHLTKRMPWSSSMLTMIWLALVTLGTITFLVMFGIDGGLHSAGGWLLAAGVAGLGALVLIFGIVTVSLAYRLEDSRLMQVYQELQDALRHTAQLDSCVRRNDGGGRAGMMAGGRHDGGGQA